MSSDGKLLNAGIVLTAGNRIGRITRNVYSEVYPGVPGTRENEPDNCLPRFGQVSDRVAAEDGG
jgi:hypothetical protein